MNKPQSIDNRDNQLGNAVRKNAIILSVFALFCSTLVAITYFFIKDKIRQQLTVNQIRQLEQIFPGAMLDDGVVQDCVLIKQPAALAQTQTQSQSHKPVKIFRLYKNNQPYAVLIPTTTDNGYAGKIKLLAGVYASGELADVSVIEHHETPGLGDAIEANRSDWIKQFAGKSLQNTTDWKISKDGGEFDTLSGATITSRAAVKAIENALRYFQQNQSTIFSQQNSCEPE